MAIWGDDRHQEIAQFLCSKIKAEIGWPNDRFVPADSSDVVLWICDDDLEIVEISWTLRTSLRSKSRMTEFRAFAKARWATLST